MNKKIGYVCSSFDCLHAGHIAMLAESKTYCDFLIVGLLSDPTIDRPKTKNKPIQSMFERWVQLQGVSYIDLVFPFESEQDLYDSLLLIRPDIRFVGEEYKGINFNGSDLDIEIYYNKRQHSFSTTELRQRIVNSVVEKPDNMNTRKIEFPT